NIVDPNGIPAGIVVALIGAPYFMYLLLKKA
ncbi:iron chelate uptake ABC transporter family permease subunit, partial [Bacillus thuringiensis]|nr:iron chelate uptake ABC transporter family permease subunit [Bacillus thuringiensis]